MSFTKTYKKHIVLVKSRICFYQITRKTHHFGKNSLKLYGP